MRYINEDFIDNLDTQNDLVQTDSTQDVEGDSKIEVNFNWYMYFADVVSGKEYKGDAYKERNKKTYDIWTRMVAFRHIFDSIYFINNYSIITKLYVYYSSQEEKYDEYDIIPSLYKRYPWNFIDNEENRQKYGDFNIGLKFLCIYSPRFCSFRKFASSMHMLFNKMKSYEFCNINIRTALSGWFIIEQFKNHPELYEKLYSYMFPNEEATGNIADAVYNQAFLERIMGDFEKKHSEYVIRWDIRRKFFDPTAYNVGTSVTVHYKNVILIDIAVSVPEDDSYDSDNNFYSNILGDFKSEIFYRIPMGMRTEFAFCIVVYPDKKMIVPSPYRPNDVTPPHGIAYGYRYINNYATNNIGCFKQFLSLKDRYANNTNMTVMFMTHGDNPRFNHRGKIQFPTGFKWALMLSPEKK